MAKHAIYNAVVTFNGVTLTDRARKISWTAGTNEGPGAAMSELQDYGIATTTFINAITIEYYQDYAASNVYITHKAIWVLGATATLTAKVDSAADSATNPNFTVTVFIKSMPFLDGARGDVHLAQYTYGVASAMTFDVS